MELVGMGWIKNNFLILIFMGCEWKIDGFYCKMIYEN